MENIFSQKRFWLLVRKHANENRKKFLISFVVMILPTILAMFMTVKNNPEGLFQYYIFFLVLIGGFYTSVFFKNWTYTARASTLLMLPATAFEKIALVMFYSVIVFIPVFTIVYYGSTCVILKIFGSEMQYLFIDQYHGLSTLPAVFIYALLPYIFFQSLVLLFSVGFKKRQTLRAFEVIAILFIIISIWNQHYIHLVTGNSIHSVIVSNQLVLFPVEVNYYDEGSGIYRQVTGLLSGGSGRYRQINSLLIANISIMVLIISTLLFYLASYFKLKEKEI